MESSKIFRIICQLFTIMLIVIVSSPLISLAFYTSPTNELNPPLNLHQDESVNKGISDVYIFNDDYSGDPPTNKPVYDLLTVAERQAKSLTTVLPAYQPYYGEKTVYLTFDDGPDPENTPIVLDLLKKHGIKATFFVTGTQAEKYPNLLKQIYQEGHAIGNHSYNHIYRDLYQSPHSYMAQLHQTDNVIKNIIGVRPNITRAPGGTVGSFNSRYWEFLKKEGYIEVGWNVSSGDASEARADDIFQNIVYQMNNTYLWSHAIVLMHDGRGHSETVKALPNIITYFKKHDFEFHVINLKTPSPW